MTDMDVLPISGRPENMFGDDIGLHLAGATADGCRETVEIGALPEAAPGGPRRRPRTDRQRRPEIDGELAHAAAHLGGTQLARQRQGARVVGSQR